MAADLDVMMQTIDEHALIEEYGPKEAFGLAAPLTDEFRTEMGQAILAVAGADDDLSDAEMTYFLGRARQFGLGTPGIKALRGFDYRAVDLAKVAAALSPALRKVVLYEAIQVARVDGFSDGEREAAERWAEALGLDPSLVTHLERQIRSQERARTARIQLLTP